MLRELNSFTQKHGNVAFFVLLVVLVGPLVFVFGSGGCNSSGGLSGGDNYGMLGKRVVTGSDFKHHLCAEAMQSYLTSGNLVNLNGIMNGNAVQDNADRVFLRMRALRLAEERGFDQVSDTELAKYKARQKAFQNDDNQFVLAKYTLFESRFFENQPITVSDFDKMCRENIVIDRLKNMLEAETTNVADIRAQILGNGGKPDYTIKEFDKKDFMNQTPSEKEIETLYAEQKDSTFQVPEQRKGKIAAFEIKLRPEGAKEITDKDLAAEYKANPKEYTTKEEVRASHILVSYKGSSRSTQTRTEAEARKRAEMIAKKCKAKNANFADLAKEFSDGPSASKGGDLGFFPFDAMTKPFSEAAFKLKRGEVSGIVKTNFGFHIIKKIATKPAKLRTFADSKKHIRRKLVDKWDTPVWDNLAALQYNNDKAAKYSKKQATIKYMKITKSSKTPKDIKLDLDKAVSLQKSAAAAKDLTVFAETTKKKYPKMKIFNGTRKDVDTAGKNIPLYIMKGLDLKVGEVSKLIDEPEAFYIVQKSSERSSQPYQEVKNTILTSLKAKARKKAETAAEKFADDLMAQLKKKNLAGAKALAYFEKVATEKKALLLDTPLLDTNSRAYLYDIMGGTSSAQLYNALRDLSPDKCYSTPTTNGSYKFIVCLAETKAAHAPELKDVRAKVSASIVKAKAEAAAQAAADKLQKELNEKLAKKLTPKELSTFRKPKDYTGKQAVPEPEKTAQSLVSSTKVGEVSIKNTPNGAVLVYMKGRELREKSELENTFTSRSKRLYNQMSWYNWYTYNTVLEKAYPFEPAEGLKNFFTEKKK